jgi:hypothetical protein
VLCSSAISALNLQRGDTGARIFLFTGIEGCDSCDFATLSKIFFNIKTLMAEECRNAQILGCDTSDTLGGAAPTAAGVARPFPRVATPSWPQPFGNQRFLQLSQMSQLSPTLC